MFAKKAIVRWILAVLELVSPVLRDALRETLIAWYRRALATERKADDILAGLVLELFGIDPDSLPPE